MSPVCVTTSLGMLVAWLSTQTPAAPAHTASGEPGPPVVYTQWRTYGTRDGLPHERVRAIDVSDGRVWVGTEDGLACLEASAWRTWGEAQGLPWPTISAIDVDERTGDVWLGTWGGGLIRFSGGRFEQFSQINSGLAGNLIFAVLADDDRVWAATNGGLSTLDPATGSWDLNWERRADVPETAFGTLARDGGRLYAAAWCGDLKWLDSPQGQWGVAGPPAGATAPTTLAVAAAGRSLWWVTLNGLWRRDRGQAWQGGRFAGAAGAGGLVRCIAAGDDGAVCLGSDQGLEMLADWSQETWIGYRCGEGEPEGRVDLIRQGRVLHTRAMASAIPDNRVRCVAFAGDDLWVGTVGGLARGTDRRRWSSLPPPRSESSAAVAPAAPAATGAVRALQPGEAVKIGILRPGNRTIAIPGTREPGVPRLGRMDRLAVSLAIELANARGGFRGQVPYTIATGPEGAFRGWGWTTPEDDFPALANQHDVWGIVGHLGPGSTLTTLVALRTEVPVVNCTPTAATIDQTVNPWIFRCGGDATSAAQFAEAYRSRFRRTPPPEAYGVFLAVGHLLEAIDTAGLERAAIRLALRAMSSDPAAESHCRWGPGDRDAAGP